MSTKASDPWNNPWSWSVALRFVTAHRAERNRKHLAKEETWEGS